MTIRDNYLVEILAPVPRRWTRYRGRTAAGQPGLIFGGNYYATFDVLVPEFTEDDTVSPPTITIVLGNANNLAIDLWSDGANRRAQVTVYKVNFDASWAITTSETWFLGQLGRPSFEGEKLSIDCHANFGRRGNSPSRLSISLMTSHKPPSDGTKTPWFTGAGA